MIRITGGPVPIEVYIPASPQAEPHTDFSATEKHAMLTWRLPYRRRAGYWELGWLDIDDVYETRTIPGNESELLGHVASTAIDILRSEYRVDLETGARVPHPPRPIPDPARLEVRRARDELLAATLAHPSNADFAPAATGILNDLGARLAPISHTIGPDWLARATGELAYSVADVLRALAAKDDPDAPPVQERISALLRFAELDDIMSAVDDEPAE